jgi:hypothetical protein
MRIIPIPLSVALAFQKPHGPAVGFPYPQSALKKMATISLSQRFKERTAEA